MAENGKLPQSSLSPAFNAGGPAVSLSHDAAAGWNTLALYSATRKDWGTPAFNGPQSAYRDYANQVRLRNEWCAQGRCENAAVAGTSNHGWGKAGDVNSAAQEAIREKGTAFGWRKTEAFNEPWHFNFVGGFGRPDPGIDRANPILRDGSGGLGQDVWVRKAQNRLRAHGLEVKVDGSYGKSTKDAVMDFQKHHNLGADGVIRKDTWRALRHEPKEKP